MQIILTDLAGVRQQLGHTRHWIFSDKHDDAVLGTPTSRQLLAYYRKYRRIRDQNTVLSGDHYQNGERRPPVGLPVFSDFDAYPP